MDRYTEQLPDGHRLVVRRPSPDALCQQAFVAIDSGDRTPCLASTHTRGSLRGSRIEPAVTWPQQIAEARKWALEEVFNLKGTGA